MSGCWVKSVHVVCACTKDDAQTQQRPMLLLLAQPIKKHAGGLMITCVHAFVVSHLEPESHNQLIETHFTLTWDTCALGC